MKYLCCIQSFKVSLDDPENEYLWLSLPYNFFFFFCIHLFLDDSQNHKEARAIMFIQNKICLLNMDEIFWHDQSKSCLKDTCTCFVGVTEAQKRYFTHSRRSSVFRVLQPAISSG